MATINYNGMELEEFTSDKPVFFDKPVRALCWNNNGWQGGICEYVIAFIPRSDSCLAVTDHTTWLHMALLPDPPKPRRATNRELARWLAQGNGQIQYDDKTKNFGKSPDGERHKALKSTTTFEYFGADDFYVVADIQVRKWLDIEWHEPTVDYLGLEGV